MTAPYTAAEILRLARKRVRSEPWTRSNQLSIFAPIWGDPKADAFLNRAADRTEGRGGTKAFTLRMLDRAIQLADQGGQGE